MRALCHVPRLGPRRCCWEPQPHTIHVALQDLPVGLAPAPPHHPSACITYPTLRPGHRGQPRVPIGPASQVVIEALGSGAAVARDGHSPRESHMICFTLLYVMLFCTCYTADAVVALDGGKEGLFAGRREAGDELENNRSIEARCTDEDCMMAQRPNAARVEHSRRPSPIGSDTRASMWSRVAATPRRTPR